MEIIAYFHLVLHACTNSSLLAIKQRKRLIANGRVGKQRERAERNAGVSNVTQNRI